MKTVTFVCAAACFMFWLRAAALLSLIFIIIVSTMLIFAHGDIPF
ncbi:hypothetical protein [Ectobacillus funiculus]|nr:hypothetical protein [Ectobacillus funiculus]